MSEMLQLHASLMRSKLKIWRRLLVDPRLTMEQLHFVLQISFGWQESHLHQFETQDGTRYAIPSEFDAWDGSAIDERTIQVGKVFNRPKKKIVYEYDFGDSWMHAVVFEKKVDGESIELPGEKLGKAQESVLSGNQRAAICIAGARNGPPEDCGGVWRYCEMLELRSRTQASLSEDDRERLEWLGDWDPEEFKLAEINKILSRIVVKETVENSGSPRPKAGSKALSNARLLKLAAKKRPPQGGYDGKVDSTKPE